MLSTETFNRLEKLQPTIAKELHNIMQLTPNSTDTELLDLCSSYINAALRNQTWAPPKRPLTEKEQAFIAFTEQFIVSVGTMDDEQVERLLQFASADEVYAFVNALYVTDMTQRLELVAGRVLA